MTRIAIIGSGIVGQATGRGFVESGHSVIFVDVNPVTLDKLKSEGYAVAEISWIEKLSYETSMICLPTPFKNGTVDLSAFHETLPFLGKKLSACDGYHLVVVRSTVPPNTCERLIIPNLESISNKRAGKDFGLCMNPEFLREKKSESDFLHPWSIVIGSSDQKSGDVLEGIYRSLIHKQKPPVIRTDLKTAEMIKYAQNLFNATKISFTNEIWRVCQKLGIDGDTVMAAVSQSAEGMWNPKYGTKAGYPYDGGCLPKDTQGFLAYARQELGIKMLLLEATIATNNSLKNKMVRDLK